MKPRFNVISDRPIFVTIKFRVWQRGNNYRLWSDFYIRLMLIECWTILERPILFREWTMNGFNGTFLSENEAVLIGNEKLWDRERTTVIDNGLLCVKVRTDSLTSISKSAVRIRWFLSIHKYTMRGREKLLAKIIKLRNILDGRKGVKVSWWMELHAA